MELPVPEMPEARHVFGSCHWGGVKPRTAAQAKNSPAAYREKTPLRRGRAARQIEVKGTGGLNFSR